jgi:hypothetical protein
MDCEVSSSRARGHLRQIVRMRWLAACIGAALYALLNAATVQRLHGTWPRFWSRYWPVTGRELMPQISYFGPVQRRHDDPDRAAARPGIQTKKGRGR